MESSTNKGNLKTKKEWIADKLRAYDMKTSAVVDLYHDYLTETGGTSTLRSYRRTVEKVRASMLELGDNEIKASTLPRIETAVEGPNTNIVCVSSEIRTLDQLLAYCKVDLNKWVVTKHVVNSWGSEVNENFQVKAWLTEKEDKKDPRVAIDLLMEEAMKYSPVYPSWVPKDRLKTENLLEISLFDHHFGQLSWGKETRGSDYDVEISRDLALQSIDYLLSRASEISIDEILLPIGNDFFNVNNAENTTYAGTSQAEDGRWQKNFISGRQLWVEIIELCMTIAPVRIIGVPGNHDLERAFYLVDSLQSWFHNAPDVTIDNGPEYRKYVKWGKCLIGYTHGHLERKGKAVLVNLMATEQPQAWADSKYREWHKGHFHATNASAFQFLDEELGVRERILPSLVDIDDYHAGKGYSHLRETTAMIWNKQKGNTDIFMFHPE